MQGFNLKRDASPVATRYRMRPYGPPVLFQSQARCQPRGDQYQGYPGSFEQVVSISSEMPAPWRLQRVSQFMKELGVFQSQARCQPRGDLVVSSALTHFQIVSISSEMPAPWRRPIKGERHVRDFFVSISSEMPAPWRLAYAMIAGIAIQSFNLKRDASPVATLSLTVAFT